MATLIVFAALGTDGLMVVANPSTYRLEVCGIGRVAVGDVGMPRWRGRD